MLIFSMLYTTQLQCVPFKQLSRQPNHSKTENISTMKSTKFFNKSTAIILALILIVVSFATIPLQHAAAATGTICDQFGSTTQGNYIVMNNRWGTTATQCINVTNNGFQIIQQDGFSAGGAPVSYPAIYAGCHYDNCSPNSGMPKQLSQISSVNTSVTVTYPGSGTYDAAYDIWLNADTNVSGVQDTEIMIWLNHTGSIQPVGSPTGSVNLAGRSWTVWVGNNGGNNVVSYVQAGITSFNADVKPFLMDAITRGAGFGNAAWYLTSVQMGFEPWSGGVGLSVNSFSSSINSGGPTPPPATPTPCTSCGSNLALNKPATSSSNENASVTPNLAVDGSAGTRWASAFSDPQWLQVDLGATQTINRVVLNWEAAYATAYQIQVSNAASGPWTTIFSTTNGSGGVNNLTVSGSGRYIRVYGTARATAYGYSLWEFEVYGSSGPTPTTPPTSTWNSVINKNSGKCVDARAASTANGTAVQQYTCNNSYAQQWQFQTTSGSYARVNNRSNATQVWDIAGTTDNALIQLWAYGGGGNQQWQSVSEGGGYYHFVSLATGKCLDVPTASTADSVQLVEYTCNGTSAQSFRLQAQP